MSDLITQTEQMEFLCYAIFGLILTCLPLFTCLFSSNVSAPKVNQYRKGWLLSLPAAVFVFWLLVRFDIFGSSVFIVASFLVGAVVFAAYTNPTSFFKPSWLMQLVLFVGFAIPSVILCFATNFFSNAGPDITVPGGPWHHWGAFLSAAKSLDAGLAIFYDFPSQYGLGVSSLIALASHGFGWVSGMFFVVGTLQLMYWGLMSIVAIFLVSKYEGTQLVNYLFAYLLLFFGCFFWVPGLNIFANVYPSLGGARFFPATLFLVCLFSLGVTTDNQPKKSIWILHAIWGLCCFWSLEAIFHVCFLWWPYYLYIRVCANKNTKPKFKDFAKPVVELLSVAAGSFVIFILLYLAVFRALPQWAIYSVFATNVPGPLPINPSGPFLFALVVFLLSAYLLYSSFKKYGRTVDYHRFFAVILLTYSAFSYYIGRSHDLNIRPFVPFFCLILLGMCSKIFPSGVRLFSVGVLSCFICWASLQQINDGVRAGGFEFRGATLDTQFAEYAESPGRDLGRAIKSISEKFGESVVAIDPTSSVTISGVQDQWSSFNNIASYGFLPFSMQRMFVNRSKKKLMKNGWVLIHKGSGGYGEAFIFELFSESYDRTQEIKFGEYMAYRFVPKKD